MPTVHGLDFVAVGSASSNRAAFAFDAGFDPVGALLAAPAPDFAFEFVAAGSASSNRAAFAFDAGFDSVGALLAAPASDFAFEFVAAVCFCFLGGRH